MRNKVQTLRNLALLGVLVGLTGLSSFTDAGEQQQQPEDICKESGSSIIVGDSDKLQPAVEDPECEEVIIQGGVYEINLVIENRQKKLTIRKMAGEKKLPALTGPKPDRQTIAIVNSKNITLQDLEIKQKAGNIGVLITEGSSNISLINNVIHGFPDAGIKIAGKSKDITIEGNWIGNVSDVLPREFGITETRANGVGISIEGESTAHKIKQNKVIGNDDNGIEILGSIVTTLSDNTVERNKKDGVQIIKSSKVTIEGQTIISHNRDDGVQVTGSTLEIKQSEIFKNTGCGINIEGSSNVTDPQGRSNIIVANERGNLCLPQPIPRSLATSLATLRRFEATVPRHFSTIKQALDQAWLYEEEKKAAERFFTIYVQSGTYNENICIPRSVQLQALGGQVKLQGNSSEPVIGIGSDNCSLEGPVDHIITIDGFEISGGSVGVQVGPGPQYFPAPDNLQITLKNFLITSNKGKGLWIIGDSNDDLNIQVEGAIRVEEEQVQSFSDLACNRVDLRNPNFQQLPPLLQKNLSSLYRVATAKIDNNGDDGITIDARDQAKVTVTLSQAIIGGDIVTGQKLNKGNGIFLKSTSEMPVQLQLNAVWVALNSKRGLEVELGGKAPNVDINLGAGSSLYRNGDSGLKVANQTVSQNLKLTVVDTHVTGNGGHGVELFGQLQAVLTTTESTSDGYCGLFANKKSGLRVELGPDIESPPGSGIKTVVQAQVQIGKLRIEKNEEHGVVVKNLTSLKTYALQLSNSQISENRGNGVLLESRIESRIMDVYINNNLFQLNKLWGVTRDIRRCLIDRKDPPPDNSYVGREATGDDRNTFSKNGSELGNREKPAGYDQQVCPKDLEFLIKK